MQFYARDLMSAPLITVRPETSCKEAIEVLSLHQIGGAPVVDERGILIGVITLSDLLEASTALYGGNSYFSESWIDRISSDGFYLENLGGYVSDLMSRVIYTAYPETPVETLAWTMVKNRIHRIIILEPEEQIPIGIVSSFDLIKLLAELRPDDRTPSDDEARAPRISVEAR